MCGIVGYIGYREAFPVLIKGLKRLEYRGYDSAGVALMADRAGEKIRVYKEKGKVAELESTSSDKDVSGTLGIAHTRWATHGEPSSKNAHPHSSQDGRLALVHNGIIENYVALKELLMKKGYTFQSDTDTEVLVQFIHYVMTSDNLSLQKAVEQALHSIVGAFAIAVIDNQDSEHLVAARRSSPLVIGIGEDNREFFLASDALPIVEYTNKMVYLNDNEVACLEIGKDITVHNLESENVPAPIKEVNLSLEELEKGGYPHFMLKEIFDQPRVIADCMRGRLLKEEHKVVLSAVETYKERLMNAKRFIIVACGTSWHAGLIGKQLIEQWCEIPVEVDYASEFRYRKPVIRPTDVVIAISQEEYEDTIDALSEIPEKMKTVLQTNEKIKHMANVLTYAKNALYMGRGYNYPVAL